MKRNDEEKGEGKRGIGKEEMKEERGQRIAEEQVEEGEGGEK